MKHKKRSILILIILVLLIGVLVWWMNARRPQIVLVGEAVVIDSKKEEEDEKKWLPTNACLFDGKIEITLLESKLYRDYDEAGILDMYVNSELEEGEYFLLTTLKIHNIDAEPVFPEGFLSTGYRLIPYHDSANVYTPMLNPEVQYSSVFQESVENDENVLQQPKEGYYFKLNSGESKEIKLGYFVQKEAYDNNKLALKYETGNAGPPKTIFLIQ